MDTSIIDYTCNVEELKGVSRDKVSATLAEVGFSEEGQAAPITSLSGGWKMKLALARAMLQEAQVRNATPNLNLSLGNPNPLTLTQGNPNSSPSNNPYPNPRSRYDVAPSARCVVGCG